MRIVIILAISTCAWSQIDRPQLGKILDANGAVHTVYGIASSVSLGDPEITEVLSSGCSKTICLAKLEASIVSETGSSAAPTGPALFAFDGDAAFVWFPQARQLARWQNDVLTPVDVDVSGEVLALRANAGAVEFAVRRETGVWIVQSDGGLTASLPHSAAQVMLLADAVVYATRDEIVIREVRIPLHHVTWFSQISSGYLQVRAGGTDYALRTDQGRETLFQLPAVHP
jgi:hypothetical protein